MITATVEEIREQIRRRMRTDTLLYLVLHGILMTLLSAALDVSLGILMCTLGKMHVGRVLGRHRGKLSECLVELQKT